MPSASVAGVLGRAIDRALVFVERFVTTRWWLAKTTALAALVSLVHAFPAYDHVDNAASHYNWQALVLQARHPFTAHDYAAASHAAKLALRLTPALIGHVLGLGVTGFMVLNAVAGLVLLALVAVVVHAVTGDRATSALVCVAVGLSYAGSLAFNETIGVVDALPLALLVGAMAVRSAPAITVLTVLACFSDERALLASVLVLLYHRMRGRTWLSPQTAAVAAGIVGYGVLRLIVTHATGLHTPAGGTGLRAVAHEYVAGPIAAWSAFEALWVFLLAAAVALWAGARRPELALFAVATGAILLGALTVVDVGRTMTYALPAVLVAIAVLAGDAPSGLRRVALVICVVSAIPNYYVDQYGSRTNASMLLPAPFQLVRLASLH